ncbi:MAG: hypothetical protein VE97_C0011G0002 [candidate division Kazan bacterium GW2011_GWB1_45_10]|uniref:Uncharacterized protein n=1 Tax=candidate division Kazan bacterium GW2011_GWB1_45_10 TaxID=1620411 RepID=A0A0G1KTF2_UNCK3|nr:MAG: hypothetical protein VE97_C0011G0002 [candidate division Kazan bacterium GW2011_GWB1_45_10]
MRRLITPKLKQARPCRPKLITQTRRQRVFAGISWLLVFTTSVSFMRWDVSDLKVTILNPKKAEAQAASQTTFYFKSDARTANTAFGVAGPTAENSTDTDELSGSPSGKTTAYSMAPIYGPINMTDTSDNVVTTEAVKDANLYIWVRTFIMPLASNTVFNSTTTFSVGMSFDESDAAANAYARAFAYVYDSGSNSNVQTLAGPTEHGTEIGTSDEGRIWTVTNAVGGTPYTTGNSDFLAVEIWLRTASNSTTSYTVTTRWGGNVAVANGTTNTAPASYITINTTTVDTSDPIYFLPTTTPPEPGPNASQTGDTFLGGTLDARRMSTVPGSGVEANIQTTSGTTPGNWRMNTFISPPLAAQTIPAGTWLIHVHGTTDTPTVNAQLRGMIYTWDADDTIGDTIIVVANSGTYWISGVANSQLEMTWSGSAATISAGERLVAEWNFVTIGTTVSGAGVAHRFGDNPSTVSTTIYDSAILPPMNYASTPTPITWQAAVYEETHFRFDEDDDNEEGHSNGWTDRDGSTTEDDASVGFNTGVNFRLRLHVNNVGAESDTLSPKLEYRVNSPPGSWVEITTSSAKIKIIASGQANFVDGTATTEQLTATSGYAFQAGDQEEDSSPSGNTTVGIWNSTEYEWSLQGVGASETYDIRMTDNGTAFDTYTVTPVLTLTGYSPRMNNWRWYADDATDTSVGALTTAYAAENTVPPQEENGKSIPYKLRINLTESVGVAENDSRKILQWSTNQSDWYAVGSTLDTLLAWRFYNGGGDDNATINTVVLTGSSTSSKGILNESSSSAPSGSDHPASTTVEWEFTIENYSAIANTAYYFNLKDEVLNANIPLGALKTYPQLTTAASYSLTVSSPASVDLGNFQYGNPEPHEYAFVGGEEITIRDNRGQTSGNSSGWSLTADVTTELNDGEHTITKANTYWISDTITGLYAAPTTNISTQSGSYMGSAVTAASVAGNVKDGLGGFTILPTMRLYGIGGAGDYTGSITLTIT